MEKIYQGATESIVLTAIDENGDINTTELENFKADVVIVASYDSTKYIHVKNSSIIKDVAKGTITIPLTTDQTKIIDNLADLELRDSSSGVRISIQTNAFCFIPNKINSLPL